MVELGPKLAAILADLNKTNDNPTPVRPASAVSQKSSESKTQSAIRFKKNTLHASPQVTPNSYIFKPRNDLIVPLSKLNLRRCIDDFEYYAANLLKIKTINAELKPLVFNSPQQKFWKALTDLRNSGKLPRIIVLKARREGISTISEGVIFHAAHFNENIEAVVISHEKDSGNKIFNMCRLFYDCLPPKLRPMTKYSNKHQLVFANPDIKTQDNNPGLRSSIEVITAGKKDVARSAGYHLLHCCLHPETEILLHDWTPCQIQDIRPGDYIRSPNGESVKVLNKFQYEDEDTGIEFTLWGDPSVKLLSTQDHRYLTDKGLKKASDITLRDYFCYPVNKITKETEYFNLESPIIQSPHPQKGGYTPKPKTNLIKVDKDLGFFFGLFLAEGSFGSWSDGKTTKGLPNCTNITVHDKEVNYVLSKLEFLKTSFSGKTRVVDREESLASNIVIQDPILARLLVSIFGLDKAMPEFLFSCGDHFVGGMVEGYLFGDGGQDKYCDMLRLTSIRPQLVYWLRDALVRLGIGWSSISTKEAGSYYGRNCKKAWIIGIKGSTFRSLTYMLDGVDFLNPGKACVEKWKWSSDKKYIHIRPRNIKEEYCFTSYDLEVESEDHLYLTGSCVTHNSEVSSWPFADEVISGLIPTIPKTQKSLIVYESTAKGIGNFFHAEWERAENGESNFYPFFLSWFDMPEYLHPFFSPKERHIFGEKLNDEEKELMSNFSLSLEQLYWRRLTIADLKGDTELFRQEYPSTAEEAFIVSGVPVFDRKKLRVMAQKTTEPEFRGDVGQNNFMPNDQGSLKIWLKPQKNQAYSLGVDVADGGEGGDYSCIQVWKKLPSPYTAEQVAEWHGHLDPYNFAHVTASIGKYYNEALIGVETNAHGLATLNELQRNYWNLYRQEHFDRYKNSRVNKLGWETTNRSKKMLISFMTHCIQDLSVIIHSKDLIRECMTFLRNAQGTADAQSGGHDDRIMSGMIGLFVMHQQQGEPEVYETPEKPDKLVIEIPKAHMIDPEFAAILEYGTQDSYKQSWLDY